MLASRKIITTFVAMHLCFAGVVGSVHGAMIGVGDVLQSEQRQQVHRQFDRVLADASVRRQLIELGVDPEHARQRVQAMTPDQLQQLSRGLQELPAGAGALEVIGIVFLVLLLLEVVGVIDIFKKR